MSEYELLQDRDFRRISAALGQHRRLTTAQCLVAEGDALSLLHLLPDHCVSLILTDPPYHATKKENIRGDTDFATDEDYLRWMRCYAVEWKRVLRDNGSLFCFCAPRLAARLEVMFSDYFNILSQITWTKPNAPGFDGWKQKMKKEALRKWYAHSERIIFAEPVSDMVRRASHFGAMLRKARIEAGMSATDLAAVVGAYGKINHGGAVSNWETGRNAPNADQYQKIRRALQRAGVAALPEYEFAIRPFTVDASKEFTDIWTFQSVRPYPGKHPAEKPSPLLEHAIASTTFPGDIVLDCFAGSGAVATAASAVDRRSVSFEIEPRWVNRICGRHGASVGEMSA